MEAPTSQLIMFQTSNPIFLPLGFLLLQYLDELRNQSMEKPEILKNKSAFLHVFKKWKNSHI